ncbi:sigma-54-dependent transcriptional regulator [Candidatus Latescibacterota bacterium]
MKKILAVDDDQAILNFLKIFLLQTGKYEIHTIQDSTKVFGILKKGNFDFLILDMLMPKVSGLDILQHIKEKKIDIKTIVITGVEDIDLAINAMKLGTYDYLFKPIDENKLLNLLDVSVDNLHFMETKKKTKEDLLLPTLKVHEAFKDIITNNEKMFEVFFFSEKFAKTDNIVLIWGESGTGKEMIARCIHKISNRGNNKFIAVNTGTFANELFSSEFFGHTKGSFTGAITDKKGFIDESNGGTLFLDEIGELPLPIQVKLLRVLQEEEFYRLGSTKNIKADVRIIAATNKDLFEEIEKGNFRKDLFFRLNINSIYLPPLRVRKEDIELLAYHFLEKFNSKYGKNIKKISDSVINLLKRYDFPGNVRELMNILNSAIIIETGDEIKKNALPYYFLKNAHLPRDTINSIEPKSLLEVEKMHIQKVLQYTRMNKTKAAKILGISRVSLISKVKKYELE